MHSDQQYIEALRHQDQAGIRAIYQQHARAAARWVGQRGGSEADAQDIFQEALMTVYEKALDPAFVLTCPLGALLHLIWSRRWVDRLRRSGRESEVRNMEERRYTLEESAGDADLLSIAEDALAEEARQQRLAQTFGQLSELCRQLLTLLSNGAPARDASEQLQLNSVDTLYRRKNACTQRWRALFLEA